MLTEFVIYYLWMDISTSCLPANVSFDAFKSF